MDLLGNLAHGFAVALTFQNLLFCLIGCLIGTAIGVLPGIGPVATISLLLPITFGQPATTAIIMLAGGFVFPVMMATLQAGAGQARGTVSSLSNVAMYAGTTIGVVGSAQAVSDQNKIGQVAVNGLGLASQNVGFLKSWEIVGELVHVKRAPNP